MRAARVTPSLLPGFGPALGVTLLGLSLVVLAPLATLLATSLRGSPAEFLSAVTTPRVLAALKLSFLLSLGAAAVSALLGLLLGWVLVRYRFPGRKVLNLLIDLPFSIPTLVAGLMIVVLFGPQAPLGRAFGRMGIQILYAPPAIVIALLFVTLPIVVRAVEPVLAEVDVAEEEAARTLGASDLFTFRKVVLPAISPAIVTGTLLGFARALGEFGVTLMIAGNIPGLTQTGALAIYDAVQANRDAEAAGMVAVMSAFAVAALYLGAKLTRRRPHAW